MGDNLRTLDFMITFFGLHMKKNVCSSSWYRELFLKLQILYRKSGALHKDFNFIVKRTCYNLRTNDKLQGTMVLGWFNLCKHFAYLCHCFPIEYFFHVLLWKHFLRFYDDVCTILKSCWEVLHSMNHENEGKEKRVQGHKCPESIQTFRLLWKWVKVAVKESNLNSQNVKFK